MSEAPSMLSQAGLKTELLIAARGLTRSYQLGRKRVPVLRGIDLDVRMGEIVALRGASGAGKSTLLHLLGGLDTPDEGQILFRERDLAQMPARELGRFRNLRIGFIFQAYHVLPELDAVENVCLPARMARVPVERAVSRAKELLQRVGLGNRMDHKPYELSGGEQQRVAIARALINDPELILADEPTGNLDSRTGAEIIDLLFALRDERQCTLILATHDNDVAARAPREAHIVDGRVEE